jgi:hypothetical protein
LKMMIIWVKCGGLDFRRIKEVVSYAAHDSWRLIANLRKTNLAL